MDDTAAPGSPSSPNTGPPPERAIARLLALSRAALRVQEALTPDAVLEAVGAELRALGLNWLYATLDADEQTVTVRAVSIAPTLLSAAERLLGRSAEGFPIAVDRVAVLRAAVRQRRAGIAAGLDAMRETLPRLPEPVLRQLLRTARIGSLIVAPLVARGRTLGVLAVWSDDLAADDMPAIVAFAQQVATAHDNARLLQEARTERARMAEVFQQAPASIAMFLGPDHVVAFANPLCLRMAGASDPAEVEGKRARDALPGLVAQGYAALLDRVYTTGLPFLGSELPARIDRRTGRGEEEGFFNVVLQPYRDSDGAVEGILLHAVEVTDQVRARRQAEALAAELTAVLEQLPVGVVIASAPSGEIVRGNARVEAILGHPVLPSQSQAADSRRRGFHGDGRPYQADEWPLARTVRTGDVITNEEIVYLRPDGRRIVVSVNAGPVRDADGSIAAGVATFQDISEQRQALAAVEAAVRERDEFLSIAAHELKTPVTGLRGFTQVLLRRLDRTGALEPTTAGGMLRQINRQAGKLAQLVNQLLDLSRLEAGRLSVEPQPVEVRPVVEEAIAAVQPQMERRTITLDAPPSLPARLDPLRVEQALINLLDNADRYSPRDRPIEVALAAAPRALHISVRDHGGGIPPERREHIFDRFYRAHTASHASGMGLGLYISRQIAELHGGALTVEFPPDGGARFVLTLPREHSA